MRLYSEKTLTQAKTSIPGMGLPITSVDVTYDGARDSWLLDVSAERSTLRRAWVANYREAC